MKMNKKGFTLIELLAIIVILAIIAVITVPIILNIIDNARKGAAKDSVVGYAKSIELAYTQYEYDQKMGTTSASAATTTAVTVDTESKELNVVFDGTTVTCQQRVITNGKLELAQCKVGTATGTNDPTYSYMNGKAYVNTDTPATSAADGNGYKASL